MTITTPTSRQEHAGNGVTTEFAVPFRFLVNGDITVFLRTAAGVQVPWTEGTQYTLTGAGLPAGGSLTVITVPTDFTPLTNEQLVILRQVAKIQETDYVENDPFPAETHEAALDRLTMISQELDEQLGRTFSIPETDTYAGGFELPGDVARALNFLAFDSLGGPIVAVGTGPTTTPVTAFMDTVLAAGTAGAARALLVAQEDVITTRGDLVIGDATPAASVLAIGAAGTHLESDGTDPAWVTPPVVVLPPGYITGLTLSNNGTDLLKDIDIAAGSATSDDDSRTINSAATITVALDAAGANGLDTGTVAATALYYYWLIGDASEVNPVAGLASLSGTAPTMPTGYDLKALIGAISTDATPDIILDRFTQRKLGRTDFVSETFTALTAALFSFKHGFQGFPDGGTIALEVECLTAELGYSIGDRFVIPRAPATATYQVHAYTTTDLDFRFANTPTNPMVVGNKTTSAGTNLTNANWACRLLAGRAS